MADANSAAERYQGLEQVDFECRSCWRVLCGREREGGKEVSSSLHHGAGPVYTPESHCPYSASLL